MPPGCLLSPQLVSISMNKGVCTCDVTRTAVMRHCLRNTNIYDMVGGCCAWLLYIIDVSVVSSISVLQENCSQQPVSHGNLIPKLNCCEVMPGFAAGACLLRTGTTVKMLLLHSLVPTLQHICCTSVTLLVMSHVNALNAALHIKWNMGKWESITLHY